jgi:hypothetical protein
MAADQILSLSDVERTTARTPIVYPPVHSAPVTPLSAAPVTPAIVTAAPVTAVLTSAAPGPSTDRMAPVRYPAVPAWRPPVWPAQPPPMPTYQPAAEEAVRFRPPVGALVLGLLLGLVVFGSTGYLVGARLAGSTVDTAPAAVDRAGVPAASGSAASASAAAAPAANEDDRTVTNRRVVGPALASLAESWLPVLADCVSSSEAGGPIRQQGEQLRVLCAVNTISVYFVRYRSAAELSKVRATRQKQNADASRIAPGAAPVAAQRPGTSGRTTGRYIEFAYRVGGRTMNGIWWDDAASTTAAYLETQWTDDGWGKLREVWQRYS